MIYKISAMTSSRPRKCTVIIRDALIRDSAITVEINKEATLEELVQLLEQEYKELHPEVKEKALSIKIMLLTRHINTPERLSTPISLLNLESNKPSAIIRIANETDC